MIATRRLAAILAADVASYSRLVRTDEEGTFARLKALRVEVIDPTIAEHHGRIVKAAGDGMLVEFNGVVDAVRCATVWQRDGRLAEFAMRCAVPTGPSGEAPRTDHPAGQHGDCLAARRPRAAEGDARDRLSQPRGTGVQCALPRCVPPGTERNRLRRGTKPDDRIPLGGGKL